jgi:hypothetical protein
VVERNQFPLAVVDAVRLDKSLRDILLPGRIVYDGDGNARRLPRYFYKIPSWDSAMKVELSTNFALWEFIQTDERRQCFAGFPLRALLQSRCSWRH